MVTVERTYTAKRNERFYHYSASWSLSGRTVLWDATVRHQDGSLAGRPNGEMEVKVVRETDAEPWVRTKVEHAIENRLGVD